MTVERVTKYPATDEELQMIDTLAGMKLDNTFEVDFIITNKKWARKYGLSAKQREKLHDMYKKKTNPDNQAASNGGDDAGLIGTICAAEKTPVGYVIGTPLGKIGPAVSYREAQAIVAWLDKTWDEIVQALDSAPQDSPPASEDTDKINVPFA